MDWWVACAVVVAVAVLLTSIPMVIWYAAVSWVGILAAGLVAASILYIIDFSFFTYYQLGTEGLLIHRHLGTIHIPYRSIRAIKRGSLRDLFYLGDHRRRFALSANCLALQVINGPYKGISISPAEPQRFIDTLVEHIDRERGQRAVARHRKKS